MKTQKYLVKIQISADKFIKVIVFRYNQKEAITWASKMGIVVSCECMGEAIQQFEII